MRPAAGPEFKGLARTDLADQVVASPAFADGRLFLRTRQSILCLGHKPD